MKVLHTSDLHIGKNLHKHKINFAHEHLFEYLIKTIIKDEIDLLLISGDIFDTTYVSVTTQKVFYDFLERLAQIKTLKDTVIISGNHDLPSMLSLATPFLLASNIHIITSIDVDNQIFNLKDKGIPYCNIVAIPFLREKDIKPQLISDNFVDIEKELSLALVDHYEKVETFVENNLNPDLPTLCLMHLFATGDNSKTQIEGEKHRDIYVGKLKSINAKHFPKNIDYFALGHIHKPQIVNKDERIVYSGSPITLNFGEKSKKKIIELIFDNKQFEKQEVLLPCFLNLIQIASDSVDDILKQLENYDKSLKLDYKEDPIFLEIIYKNKKIETSINDKVEDFVKTLKNNFKILLIRLDSNITRTDTAINKVSLDMLSPRQIFDMTFADNNAEKLVITDQSIFDMFDSVVDEVIRGDK